MLDQPDPNTAVDLARVELATRDLLRALGADLNRPGLRDTPSRVAQSWREFFSSEESTTRPHSPQVAACGGFVTIRDIDFVSVCEHHLLPFSGVVHIAYQPSNQLLGLSEFARVVRGASSALQLQEELTSSIVDRIHSACAPIGTLVLVEARHGCVSDRGLRQQRTRAITTAARGSMEAPALQSAVLSMIQLRGQSS